LCESRTINVTLQFGPFDGKACGADSQVRAVGRPDVW
jgi:hypothetical protein